MLNAVNDGASRTSLLQAGSQRKSFDMLRLPLMGGQLFYLLNGVR